MMQGTMSLKKKVFKICKTL